MLRNPYKYMGSLELEKDKLILIPRDKDLDRVVEGIKDGQYWVILGIRQTGKTTFLRQIENRFRNAYTLYINFQISPKKEQNFYQWLMTQFMEQIPSEQEQVIKKEWRGYAPPFRFIQFLENFKPKNSKRKNITPIGNTQSKVRGVSLKEGICAFRNKVFERFLKDYLDIPTMSETY
jgi:hypothetical protein